MLINEYIPVLSSLNNLPLSNQKKISKQILPDYERSLLAELKHEELELLEKRPVVVQSPAVVQIAVVQIAVVQMPAVDPGPAVFQNPAVVQKPAVVQRTAVVQRPAVDSHDQKVPKPAG